MKRVLGTALLALVTTAPGSALACAVCTNPSFTAPAVGPSGGKIDHFRLGADFKVGSVRAGNDAVDDRPPDKPPRSASP